jgi:hypothetical protein
MRSFFLLTATVHATAALALTVPPTAADAAAARAGLRHRVLHTAAGGTLSCYRTFARLTAPSPA